MKKMYSTRTSVMTKEQRFPCLATSNETECVRLFIDPTRCTVLEEDDKLPQGTHMTLYDGDFDEDYEPFYGEVIVGMK